MLAHQFFLAIFFGCGALCIGAGRSHIRLDDRKFLGPAALEQIGKLAFGLPQPRLGRRQCHPGVPVLDCRQQCTGRHMLALAHRDGCDTGGDGRGDEHIIALGVTGRQRRRRCAGGKQAGDKRQSAEKISHARPPGSHRD